MPGQDALDADAFAEHEGGFAAAAAETGANPALYHLDSTIPGAPKIRTLGQEIARSLRDAPPIRAGFRARCATAIAARRKSPSRSTISIVSPRLTDAVGSAQFDLMFDATLGDDAVRAFLVSANRQAACHMAGVFEEAAKRGFWLSRRNSSARILASVLQEAA